MDEFLLFCKDENKNANDLLPKLKSSDKWTLAANAGNIVPDNFSVFKIKSPCTLEEIEKELYNIFEEILFMVTPVPEDML